MSEWPFHPLSAFVDPKRSICYGIVQPGSKTENGTPIIRVNNFQGGSLNTDEVLRVEPSIEQKYTRSRLRGGEILLTLVGTMGLTAIVPKELAGWNVARAVGVVPLRSDADVRWINFVLRSGPAQEFIKTRANTTVQATFNLRDLALLPIPLPPNPMRSSMTALLSGLDDKIELNRRMNETLEAMARAIFKDWFVDFGPTRAKAESRPPYLAPHIWSLFPDRLDDEDKPEGWPLGLLKDIIVLQRGFDLPKSGRTDGDYPVIAASGVNGTHIEAKVSGPGVATGRSGILGETFYIHDDFWPLNTSLWVKEFPKSSPVHAYFLIQTLDFASFNSGSAVPTLNRNHVHSLLMPITPKGIVQAFDDVVEPLLKQQRHNELETRTLAQTRDLLLPKLVSGEIRLRDAEKAVEAVA